MHTHTWQRREDLSVPGELTRFSCACGAYGYRQLWGSARIRVYAQPLSPHRVRQWRQYTERMYSLSDPVGTYHPESEVEPLERTQQGHWGVWHDDDRQ